MSSPEMAEGSVVGSRAHAFVPYGNEERHRSCARCGRPRDAHGHPELQKAAFTAATQRALTAFAEGDRAEAVRQLGFARWIAEEET